MNARIPHGIGLIVFGAVALAAQQAIAQQGVRNDPLLPIDQTAAYQQSRIRQVMHVLAVSINKRDFSEFKASPDVAPEFRNKYSNAQMAEAFKSLIDSRVDLTHLDTMTPVIDGTQVTLFNGLDIKGHYASTPTATFDFGFVRQGADLVAADVKVHIGGIDPPPAATAAPASAAAAPMAAETAAPAAANESMQPPTAAPGASMTTTDQVALAEAAMHAFVAAVRAKDKNVFLSSALVSSQWQANQFSRQFDANFEDAMAADSDVATLDGRTPTIKQGNTRVDPEGRVYFLAFYPGRKQHLLQLGCVNENGAWRLTKFAL